MKKNYPTLLSMLLSMALMPTAASAQSDDPIIHTPPTGTVYNLYRHTTGYESFFYNAMPHEGDGNWSRMVVADDGAVYVENPVNSFYTQSWMKGYKTEGDTICFDFPQAIYSEEGASGTEYGYLFRMKQTADGRNYEVDADGQTMKYVFRNDSLIKVDDDMLGVGMEDGSWISYGELTSENRVVANSTIAPADPASVRDGMMLYMSGQSARQYPVKWAVEGNEVYIGSLSTNLQNGFWMKGNLENGVAYFPSSQLLGIDTITRTYVYAVNATVTEQEDPYSGTYYEPSFLDEPMDFDYDAAEGTLFFRGNLVINRGVNTVSVGTAFDIYQHPQISAWEDVPGQPLPPIFTNYMPFGPTPYGGEDGGIEFKVSFYDVDGNYLNPTKLYYNLYFDDELYTFTPAEYTDLQHNMTDIPFGYKDRDFEQVDENTRRVYFYHDYKRFGVEAFYIDGDTRIGSGITTYDTDPSGIDDQAWAGKQIESVTYTDLQGRQMDRPSRGINLRTVRYSDGTVKTQKVATVR